MTRTAWLGAVVALALVANASGVLSTSSEWSAPREFVEQVHPGQQAPPVIVSVASACAPSSTPCEDVHLHDAQSGRCVTNLGRPCIEAIADNALRRRMLDPTTESMRAGDIEVLEVVDERTLIVGFADGDVDVIETRVLEEPTHVVITVVVADPALAPPQDGSDVTAVIAVLMHGRVIVTLDEPLADRGLTLDLLAIPPP